MPIRSVKMRPGIDSQKPSLMNEGGWSSSQLIRFMDGMPQAMGGWIKWWTSIFDTPARTIKSWADLNGNVWTAVGTDTSVYVIGNGNITNITPLTATTNPSVNFSTTLGSSTVTVVDNLIGTISGSYVNIITPVAVGGLILQGLYPIISFVGSDGFTIDAGANATANVSNGGAVPVFYTTISQSNVTVTLANNGESASNTFGIPISTTVGGVTLFGSYLVQSITDANDFVINAGSNATSTANAAMNGGAARFVYYGVSQINGQNYGYGIGGYGDGGYGQGSVYSGGSLPTVPLWTFDNWGETLLICGGGGSIFSWTPGTGETQAQLIGTSPTVNNGIFIAMPELTVVAWGSSVNGVQEPLLVQWSTEGDYTNWTPSVTNQAGNQMITSGSRIMGGIQGAQQALIFTDIDVWAMNYLGGTGEAELAWGFIKIADHCGLIASRAMALLDDAVFWLAGPPIQTTSPQPTGGRFMVYTGGAVMPIPCTVWDKLFQDLDWSNAHKIIAGTNSLFHEVAWYYPSISGGTGENDSYVKFNTIEKVWDFGKLPITGWQDFSPVGFPLAGHADMYLYQHEVGNTADVAPLNWSITTGAIMISEGDQMMFVDWVLPEFQWGMTNNSNTNQPVTVTMNAYRFANDTIPVTQSVITYSSTGNGFGNPRIRGRHVTFTFTGQGFTRIGDVRYRAAPDGRY